MNARARARERRSIRMQLPPETLDVPAGQTEIGNDNRTIGVCPAPVELDQPWRAPPSLLPNDRSYSGTWSRR